MTLLAGRSSEAKLVKMLGDEAADAAHHASASMDVDRDGDKKSTEADGTDLKSDLLAKARRSASKCSILLGDEALAAISADFALQRDKSAEL